MMLQKGRPETAEAFVESLERYLTETLHDRIHVSEYADTNSLPTFLKQAYRFYYACIAYQPCIFALAKDVSTPSNIAKHVTLIRSNVDAIVVLATPSLSAHNRSRLIQHGVAFVVPGNQLYIPELAMDLREHFRAPKARRTEGLSPAAQAVLFHHLMRLDEHAITPSQFANRLRYSAMSIGRAFDDLVNAGLATDKRLGKERHLLFTSNRWQLLETARDFLRTPVQTTKFVRAGQIGPPLKQAGESALSILTDLSRPSVDTFAVPASEWKVIAKTHGMTEVDEQAADYIVETWSYDPAGLSDTLTVDPLSLFAQFKDHRDERIAKAAEALLDKVRW